MGEPRARWASARWASHAAHSVPCRFVSAFRGYFPGSMRVGCLEASHRRVPGSVGVESSRLKSKHTLLSYPLSVVVH
eukprot:4916625-Prymnesium_polylepis.1